jgi:hypothetical protein
MSGCARHGMKRVNSSDRCPTPCSESLRAARGRTLLLKQHSNRCRFDILAAAFRRSDPDAERQAARNTERRGGLHRGADTEPWQIAMEQLIDAAEGPNFIMHARIGMMRDRRLRWRDNAAGPLPSWQSALSTSPPGGPCRRDQR